MPEPEFRWPDDTWNSEIEAAERRDSARRKRFTWLGVFAMAAAFGLLANTAVSTSLACLMFGVEEFRVARWLRRADPVRRRGRVCSWFYLAWGLLRISLASIGIFFFMNVVAQTMTKGSSSREAGSSAPPPEALGCVLIMMFSFFVSTAVSSLGLIGALRQRVFVWVGPEARRAFLSNAWPPRSDPRRGSPKNRTKIILLTALITITMSGFIIATLPLAFAFPKSSETPTILIVCWAIGLMIGVPILILFLVEKLGSRMIAATPEACWSGDGRIDR